jgi:hypothetical protein
LGSVRRRFRLGVVSIFALVAALSACTEKPSTLDDIPDSSPAGETTWTPEQQQAATDALAVYKAFWGAQAKAANAGIYDSPDLKKYGTDPVLTTVTKALANLAVSNAMQVGEAKLNPKVTKVDLTAAPARVTIEDCVDERGLKAVSRTNRSPIPIAPTAPYISNGTVIRSPDGRWLVSESVLHTDRPC